MKQPDPATVRDATIRQIRARWDLPNWSLDWAAIPPERRARVIGDLEEMVRCTRDAEPQLADDMNAALDFLDAGHDARVVALAVQARDDIAALLEALDAAARAS